MHAAGYAGAVHAAGYAGTAAAEQAAIEQRYPHLLWQRGSGRYFESFRRPRS